MRPIVGDHEDICHRLRFRPVCQGQNRAFSHAFWANFRARISPRALHEWRHTRCGHTIRPLPCRVRSRKTLEMPLDTIAQCLTYDNYHQDRPYNRCYTMTALDEMLYHFMHYGHTQLRSQVEEHRLAHALEHDIQMIHRDTVDTRGL